LEFLKEEKKGKNILFEMKNFQGWKECPQKSGIRDFRSQISEKNLGHVLRIPPENKVLFNRKRGKFLFLFFVLSTQKFSDQIFQNLEAPEKRLIFLSPEK